jgi:glutamate-1-semialdehyde 2,1-aminomutase
LDRSVPPGICVNRIGSMFTLFMQPGPVADFESAKRSDTAKFSRLFHFLLERGIYFPPSQFEAGFISSAHTDRQIAQTAQALHDFGASDR